MSGVNITLKELVKEKTVFKNYSFNIRTISNYQKSGQFKTKLYTQGMEFKELRPYNIGDDLRTVDWKKTAKTGKLHTKVFTEEKEKTIQIIIDLRDNMFFGTKKQFKSVLAAKIISKILQVAENSNDSVSVLILQNNEIKRTKFSNKKNQNSYILKKIIDVINNHKNVINKSKFGLSDTLSKIQSKNKNIIFIISDFYDIFYDSNAKNNFEILKNNIKNLRKKNDIVCINTYDYFEHNMEIGEFNITNGSAFSRIFVDNDIKLKFQKENQNKLQAIKNFLLKNKMTFLNIRTDDNINLILKKYLFKQKGVV